MERTRSALRARGPSLSSVSPSRWARQSLKAHPSLGDILACWVLFFPFNEIVIKRFPHGCRRIRNCIPVPGGAISGGVPLVPPLLEHTHMHTCGCATCTLVLLCPGSSNQSFRSARCQPCPPPWTGREQVSTAPRSCVAALAWPSTISPSLWAADQGPGGEQGQ